MEIIIGLARADFECLLHEVPRQSPSYAILRRCLEIYPWATEKPFSMCVVIKCNREEASVLLEVAKEHCPQAVRDILYGFKAAGSKPDQWREL